MRRRGVRRWARRGARIGAGIAREGALTARVKARTRQGCTARHGPAKVLQVADIPRTKNTKIVELAVREVVHGRPVKNREALANPEALELYRDLEELRV